MCVHTHTNSKLYVSQYYLIFSYSSKFLCTEKDPKFFMRNALLTLSIILLMGPHDPSTGVFPPPTGKLTSEKLGQPYELASFSTQGNNSRQQVGRFCLVLRAALLGVRLTGLSQREATPWHSAGAAGRQAPSVLWVR